jgi:hypothetical protein
MQSRIQSVPHAARERIGQRGDASPRERFAIARAM